MVTLDSFFYDYAAWAGGSGGAGGLPKSIDVLKLDAEGYEMGALRGAEQLLAEGRVHYLVLEFHPGMLGSTGTDPRGLLEFLQHYCFLCHSMRMALEPRAVFEFITEQMLECFPPVVVTRQVRICCLCK